jgi:hypothetical protein
MPDRARNANAFARASGRRYQAERLPRRFDSYQLSCVDEAKSMTEKQLKTAYELKRITSNAIYRVSLHSPDEPCTTAVA